MEVLGAVSGAVGIVGVALHWARILIHDIESFKDAPIVLVSLKSSLDTTKAILVTVKDVLDDDARVTNDFKALVRSDNVKNAIQACSKACQNFHSQLQGWLKHSSTQKISTRDRFVIGFFQEKTIVAFKTELEICKSTVSLALNSANFLAACEQDKKTRQYIANQELELARSPGQPSTSTGSDQPAAEPTGSSSLQSLQANVDRNDELMTNYELLLAKCLTDAKQKRANVVIDSVKIERQAKGLVGVHNTDGSEGDLDVKIGKVELADKAVAVVGFTKGVNIGEIFWNTGN